MSFYMPWVLSRYTARQFIITILTIWAMLAGLILLIDLIEMFRRVAERQSASIAILFELAFLKLPGMAQKVLPFAVLIGCMLTLSRLSRTSELTVARAAGISIWQFLAPAMATTLLLGMISVTVFNPISAVMLSRFEKIEAKYIKGRTSLLSLSAWGLWLRQEEDDVAPILNRAELQAPEVIVHALRVAQQDMQLYETIFFLFDRQSNFLMRLDAEKATLKRGHWQLEEVTLTRQDTYPLKREEIRLKTNLTANQIQNSFAPPETISFWELPGFIRTMEAAGFSAVRHKLYWHSLLASPLLMLAMILISAVFALRPQRLGKTGMLLSIGIMLGFILYFTTDLIQALGLSGTLPTAIAAWTPALISTAVGLLTLLHYEDG